MLRTVRAVLEWAGYLLFKDVVANGQSALLNSAESLKNCSSSCRVFGCFQGMSKMPMWLTFASVWNKLFNFWIITTTIYDQLFVAFLQPLKGILCGWPKIITQAAMVCTWEACVPNMRHGIAWFWKLSTKESLGAQTGSTQIWWYRHLANQIISVFTDFI